YDRTHHLVGSVVWELPTGKGKPFLNRGLNPVIDIGYFGYPAAFTPGNLGRNVVTGIPLVVGQISAQKNIHVNERLKFQVRWDFQNFMKTWTFLSPTTTVDLQNPQTFGKVRAEARTAEWGGQPIMHLTLALSF